MKLMVAASLIALCLSGCSSYGSGPTTASRNDGARLTDDEKHRLYTAALAASESPLDSVVFKKVCRKIGIFDADGSPNDNYMGFVTAHLEWAMKSETEQFKLEINTKEKAREYIEKYLP